MCRSQLCLVVGTSHFGDQIFRESSAPGNARVCGLGAATAIGSL